MVEMLEPKVFQLHQICVVHFDSCSLEDSFELFYHEEIIQNATNKLTKEKTSIIIAHRLDTIKKADKIVVLERGKIIEQGTHSELLKIKNSFYNKLNKKNSIDLVEDF